MPVLSPRMSPSHPMQQTTALAGRIHQRTRVGARRRIGTGNRPTFARLHVTSFDAALRRETWLAPAFIPGACCHAGRTVSSANYLIPGIYVRADLAVCHRVFTPSINSSPGIMSLLMLHLPPLLPLFSARRGDIVRSPWWQEQDTPKLS